MRLYLVFVAKMGKRAAFAVIATRHAVVSAKLHDAVAKIALLLGCDERNEMLFHLFGRFIGNRNESEAARNADAVGIGNDGRLVINIAKEKICDLSANAGEGQKRLHRVGKLAAKFFDEHFRGGNEIARLGFV